MVGGLILKNLKPLGHNSRIMKLSTLNFSLCNVFFLHFFHTINLPYPNNQWNKHQRHSGRCDSFAPSHITSPNQKSVSNHYQNHNEKPSIPSTQDGAALVVPATCPGKQEHLTVWDLSSILFLLQHRCAAITSQVPAFTWTESTNKLTTVRTDPTALSPPYMMFLTKALHQHIINTSKHMQANTVCIFLFNVHGVDFFVLFFISNKTKTNQQHQRPVLFLTSLAVSFSGKPICFYFDV